MRKKIAPANPRDISTTRMYSVRWLIGSSQVLGEGGESSVYRIPIVGPISGFVCSFNAPYGGPQRLHVGLGLGEGGFESQYLSPHLRQCARCQGVRLVVIAKIGRVLGCDVWSQQTPDHLHMRIPWLGWFK